MSQQPQCPIETVIDDAYRVFAKYSSGPELIVCNCNSCMSVELEAELLRTPLREIPSNLLAEYTNSAHGWDNGTIREQMRYFLPRYLELIAADDVPSHLDLEQCLIRLADANWRATWPDTEVAVLDRFFDALIVARVDDLSMVKWPVGWSLTNDVEAVLCLTVLSGGDLNRVLQTWEAAPDPQAAIHMAAVRSSVSRVGAHARLASAYLEKRHDEAATIGRFLDRPEIDRRLEAAFFVVEDMRLQQILSDAIWTQR